MAWALWDTGAAGVSAVVVTFVFSVYLTGTVGKGLPGGVPPASWLGRALAIAGLTIAVLAPVIGVWVEDARRRRIALTVLTGMVVALVSAMSLIRDRPQYLWPGLALLAIAAACGDLASVPYNAMLRQISTPQNSGRISGFGLAAAFVGSVGLLLTTYFGCIVGKGDTRGFLQLPISDGTNVRVAMLLAAGWFVLFALPLLLTAPRLPSPAEVFSPVRGVLGSYRKLWQDLVTEWHRDRNLVYYLVASAVFRDGLAGVFTFGGVLGVNAYGISPADVLIFGVAASVVAARRGCLRRFSGRLGRVQARHHRITGQHHRGGADHDGVVGASCVLAHRAAAVSVHRPGAGIGADPAAEDVQRRKRRRGLRPLHHDRACGVVRGAVAVFGVRRRFRRRPRRHGRPVPGDGGWAADLADCACPAPDSGDRR